MFNLIDPSTNQSISVRQASITTIQVASPFNFQAASNFKQQIQPHLTLPLLYLNLLFYLLTPHILIQIHLQIFYPSSLALYYIYIELYRATKLHNATLTSQSVCLSHARYFVFI